jgi:hypothetical protein
MTSYVLLLKALTDWLAFAVNMLDVLLVSRFALKAAPQWSYGTNDYLYYRSLATNSVFGFALLSTVLNFGTPAYLSSAFG